MPHKLLLADDSVTIQRVIELTFADEDVQVTAVGNGQEAIDRVQRDRPDIVLADVGMPERNGYEVAAFVKGNPSTAHIPVVLLTGAFEPVDEGRARAVGCDGVLVKPFEPQIVISRVKDLLAGRAPAGMWNAPPAAQGPVRQPPDSNLRAPAPAAAPSSDPLEAYFDRLDAAFASSGSGGSAADPFAGVPPSNGGGATTRETIPLSRRPAPGEAPAAQRDPFSDWDPDLKGDPAPPAPETRSPQKLTVAAPPAAAPPAAPPPPSMAASAPPPAAASHPAPAPPAQPAALPASLVDAFAALLAAEQKIGLAPSAAPPPSAGAAPTPPEPPPITDEMIDEISSRVLARLSADARPSILDVAERLVREEIERIKKNA
ncbi:MAG TPA: response regulator [Vicinamibacterales bacterium]|nr:response regulator [Vicinamibacterales bacterium]